MHGMPDLKAEKNVCIFFKTEFLNTTGEAGRMCDKVIPHTNVTISVDNRTTNATT